MDLQKDEDAVALELAKTCSIVGSSVDTELLFELKEERTRLQIKLDFFRVRHCRDTEQTLCMAPVSGPSVGELSRMYMSYCSLEDRYSLLSESDLVGISPANRRILVDWMVRVHENFGYGNASLEGAFSILNRFCSVSQDVTARNLQLYGVAALLISTKFYDHEELRLPMCSALTANSWSPDQIAAAEVRILDVLGFNIMLPTAGVIVDLIVKACLLPEGVRDFSNYLVQKSLTETSVLHFRPSLLAASCIFVSLKSLRCSEDTDVLLGRILKFSRLELDELEISAGAVNVVALAPAHTTRTKRKLDAVERKFAPILKRHVALSDMKEEGRFSADNASS